MKKRNSDAKRRIRIDRITFGIALLLILSPFSAEKTCSANAKDETKSTITATQDLAFKPNYRYNWIGRPDPFKPFIEIKAKAEKKEKKKAVGSRPISPLQRLELSEIRLVGIAGNDRVRKAIVEDNQKKFYPIEVGTAIGTNNGVIKEILVDRVVIEEKSKVLGRIKVKHITMKLHTSEGEVTQ
ncbi:MAG: pilus assembly protein PilP [Deltaproteobacteria bacterium]|nr:pilus assembly protein PilP [Deltaproteobacteria bacterium]